jgi:HEAT repeat protein
VEEGELAGFKALGGIDSREALSTVLDLLEVADGFERIPALGAAARLGHAKSADELAELTDTEDGHWAAIELVRAGDRRGLEPCIAAVGSDYHDVCRSAMEVLGSYGDTSAIDSLSDRFEGPNDEHRAVARRALRKLGRAV